MLDKHVLNPAILKYVSNPAILPKYHDFFYAGSFYVENSILPATFARVKIKLINYYYPISLPSSARTLIKVV